MQRLKGIWVTWGRVASNTAWMVADWLVRIGAGLLVGVWLARYLGPEQFGLFSYITAYTALWSVLAGFGIDSIVIRQLVVEPEQRETILGTAFCLKLFGAVITGSGAIATSFLLETNSDIRTLICIAAFGSLCQAFDTIDFWFQSQISARYSVYAKNAAFLFATVLRVTSILLKAPLIIFVCLTVLELALSALGLLAVYGYNRLDIRHWRPSLPYGRQLLSESWPLLLSSFAITIYTRIDQVMISTLASKAQAGIYAAAVRISEAWYAVPLAMVNSTFPLLVETRQNDKKLYYQRLQKFFHIMVVLAYGVGLLVTILAEPVISLLFGGRYEEAVPVLAVRIWAGVFVALGVARGIWINAEGLTRFSLISTVIGAIFNVFANFFLVPKFGALGAACATLLSTFIVATLTNLLFRDARRILRMQLKSLLLQFQR